MKESRILSLGEKIEGIMLRPELVHVMGVIDSATAGYAVAIKLVGEPGSDIEPVVIMVPLENVATLIRLLQEKSDELQVTFTAARV